MMRCDFEDSESEEWVFLIGCTDDQEASMIESFLTCENIFVLRKYGGAGDYLRITCGMTIFGIDLFVKRSQFEVAKEIICEVIGTMDLDKTDSKLEERTTKSSVEAVQNKGKKRLFLIAVTALIFILGSLIVTIISTVKNFVLRGPF